MKCSRVSDTEVLAKAKNVARRALPDKHPEIDGLRDLFVGAFIAGYLFAFGVGRPKKRKPK